MSFVIKCYMLAFQICNSKSFVQISQSTMNVLAFSKVSLAGRPPCYISGDEATGFSSDEDFDEECDYGRSVSYTRKWDMCKQI